MKAERVHFGWFVRQRRVRLGLTIRSVATAADVSEPTVIAWEKLERPDSIYESNYGKLAVALQWTPEDLDRWKETAVPPPRESRRPNAGGGEMVKIRKEMKARATARGMSERELYGALINLLDSLSEDEADAMLRRPGSQSPMAATGDAQAFDVGEGSVVLPVMKPATKTAAPAGRRAAGKRSR